MTDLFRTALITPRLSQQEALDAIRADAKTHPHLLAEMPCSSGKTRLACLLSQDYALVLFITHQGELLEQAVDAFTAAFPDETVARWQAGEQPGDANIVIASQQTLWRQLNRVPRDRFALVIYDEAHHAASDTARIILETFTPELRLGLTATPERGDDQDLLELFSKLSYRLDVAVAVERGEILAPTALQVLTGVRVNARVGRTGEYLAGGLERNLNTPERNTLVARKYLQHAQGRAAIAFGVNIRHIREFAGVMQGLDIKADAVWGTDPLRSEKFRAYRNREIDVLCVAGLGKEGLDLPHAEVALMATAYRRRGPYVQAASRVLRALPGKAQPLIVDFTDHAHRLAGAWEPGVKYTPELAPAPVQVQPQYRSRKQLHAQVKAILACPINIQVFERVIDLMRPKLPMDPAMIPDRAWVHDPVTAAQAALLIRNGMPVPATKGVASLMIGRLPARVEQLHLLLMHGYDVFRMDWTMNEADRVLRAHQRRGDLPVPVRVEALKACPTALSA